MHILSIAHLNILRFIAYIIAFAILVSALIVPHYAVLGGMAEKTAGYVGAMCLFCGVYAVVSLERNGKQLRDIPIIKRLCIIGFLLAFGAFALL